MPAETKGTSEIPSGMTGKGGTTLRSSGRFVGFSVTAPEVGQRCEGKNTSGCTLDEARGDAICRGWPFAEASLVCKVCTLRVNDSTLVVNFLLTLSVL